MLIVNPKTNDDEYLLVYYIEKNGFIYCLSEITTGISRFGETPTTLSGWKVLRNKQKLKNQLKTLGLKDPEFEFNSWDKLRQKVKDYFNEESEEDSLSPFYIDYENVIPKSASHLKETDYHELFN